MFFNGNDVFLYFFFFGSHFNRRFARASSKKSVTRVSRSETSVAPRCRRISSDKRSFSHGSHRPAVFERACLVIIEHFATPLVRANEQYARRPSIRKRDEKKSDPYAGIDTSFSPRTLPRFLSLLRRNASDENRQKYDPYLLPHSILNNNLRCVNNEKINVTLLLL